MSELIIIAGPQAAGKSTTIARLNEQCQSVSHLFPKHKIPLLFPLQESRQIVVHKHMLLGGIFMTAAHETEVVSCDLGRMDILLGRKSDHLVYIDECNLFTIAHAAAHGITEIDQFWNAYISRLERLNAKVIFLEVSPEVSWERRRQKYERRLVYFAKHRHARIMERYRRYMFDVYPRLLSVYRKIPFPKEFIADSVSEQDTVQKVGEALSKLSSAFRRG